MPKPRELAGSFEPTPESVASSSASQSRSPSQAGDGALRSQPNVVIGNHGNDRFSGQYSGSTQVDANTEQEFVDQQDFAQKRQSRIKRSGGFLLESALPSIRNKVSIRGRKQREDKGKSKEKEKDNAGLEPNDGRGLRSQHGSVRSSPLSKEIKPPENGPSPEHRNSKVRPETPDSRHSRTSNTSENASNASGASHDRGYRDTFDRPPAIDPTQLVTMALNLSESRRRNYGAGQLVATPLPNKGRVVSTTPDNSLLLQGSYYNSNVGGSLKQHLQQQRRVSRNISPGTGRSSPRARHVSNPQHLATTGPLIPLQYGIGHESMYQFSQATRARADKARDLLELTYHYRRLLQHLPPLRPDALAAGNTRISSLGVPGTPNFQLIRTPTNANDKHPLGRPYNPLQMIRNRRMRARERRTLDPEPSRFENLDHSIEWVNTVEDHISYPSYREQDAVILPEFGRNSDDHTRIRGSGAVTGQKRPKLEWSFSPAELFADAYWLEKDNNKSHIYSRHGYKIFETKRPPSAVPARVSAEFNRVERTRTTSNESQVGTAPASIPGDESDRASDRGRKRRLFRGEKRGGRTRSKSSSGLSSADEASEKGNGALARTGAGEFNTGPLQGYLNNLIQEERAEASPTIDSPDHWGTGHVSLTGKAVPQAEKPTQDTNGLNGSATGTVKKKPAPIKAPIAARDFEDDGVRSSVDELSSVPNSPGLSRFSPRASLEIARSSIRGLSPKKTPGKSKLAIRPDLQDRNQTAESYESAPEIEGVNKSRQASGENHTPDSSTSSKLASNVGVKHLFSHRRNESRSSVLDRSDTRLRNENRDSKEFKEPHSAVTRFFKGVKHEGSKVGDRIFGKDSAGDETEPSSDSDKSDVSESENAPKNRSKKRPHAVRRTTTTETLGSVGTTKPYRTKHLKLPTFRSTHAPSEDEDHTSTAGDDTDAQNGDRRGRMLPKLDLRKLSSKTPSGAIQRADETDNSLLDPLSDLERTRSRSAARNRLANTLDRPGSFGPGTRPITSLARLSPSPSRTLNLTRQITPGNRHWSISDRKPSQAPSKTSPTSPAAITTADLARTRALLLCTGIKAREIARRARLVRAVPAPFLVAAFDSAGLDAAHRQRVPRQEEHVLAARILCEQLTTSTSQLRAATETFRDQSVANWHVQLQGLRGLLVDSLEPQIKSCVADAETYASRLSRVYPLETKTVYERAGVMLRARRRRGRWIRRSGWALVEYLLLGFMWFVWLVVSVVKMFRAVGVGAVRAVRWVLWLP